MFFSITEPATFYSIPGPVFRVFFTLVKLPILNHAVSTQEIGLKIGYPTPSISIPWLIITFHQQGFPINGSQFWGNGNQIHNP